MPLMEDASFVSSVRETLRDSLRMASGSMGYCWGKEDEEMMEEKHESGYRVTLQTVLIAELEGCSSDSVLVWWIKDARERARVRVRKRMVKMERVAIRGFENLRCGGCC